MLTGVKPPLSLKTGYGTKREKQLKPSCPIRARGFFSGADCDYF